MHILDRLGNVVKIEFTHQVDVKKLTNRRRMFQKILIICIGNICRSPIGEVLFREKFNKASFDVTVSSAGLGALVDHQADPVAQELMTLRGLDISGHRARQLSQGILFGSDLILTMTSAQQEQIELEYPSARGRVHRIGKWESYDVPDPYKRPKLVFEQALALIDQGVDEWHRKLWN